MGAPVNDLATEKVKLGQEAFLSRNFGSIDDVGMYVASAASSGTYTPDADYVFPVAGADLVVRVANGPIKAATNLTVAIIGTKVGGGSITGWATIKANSPEDTARIVTEPSGDYPFASITSVQVTGGVAGDGFEILVLPNTANDVIMCYLQDLSLQRGKTVKQIFCNYTLMHNKRLRGDRTLTASIWYTNNMEGLALINDRDVVLRVDIKDDGGNLITETRYIDKVRIGTGWDKPAGDDAEITNKGDGSFGRQLIFS